jgi:hypothetical protein
MLLVILVIENTNDQLIAEVRRLQSHTHGIVSDNLEGLEITIVNG